MNDLNQVVLIGRVTKDPELKTVGSSQVCNFSIANNQKYGDKETVSFFDCAAWGKLAELIAQYAKKGKQVCISGRLEQNTWDTPDGKKESRIKITVENCQFLSDPKTL